MLTKTEKLGLKLHKNTRQGNTKNNKTKLSKTRQHTETKNSIHWYKLKRVVLNFKNKQKGCSNAKTDGSIYAKW